MGNDLEDLAQHIDDDNASAAVADLLRLTDLGYTANDIRRYLTRHPEVGSEWRMLNVQPDTE